MDNKKAIMKEVLEWVYCIAIAVVLALLIRYFIGTPTIVRQKSMFPTLKEGQRLILNRMVKTFKQDLQRGDIITFEAPKKGVQSVGVKAVYDEEPKGWFNRFTYYVLEIDKISYIKRVIGIPGDKIVIENGKVFLNGEELEESYLQDGVETQTKNPYLADFTVPEGYIFAMGDNRSNSTDCREFGCVPIEKVESKVWIRFWPLNLFGKVDK